MKNCSKIIIFIVLSIFLITVCSCSSVETEEVLPEWEITEQGLTDFNGQTYYFSADIDTTSETFLSYIKNTKFGDAAMQRFKEVENQYNCKIVKSSSVKSVENIFLNSAAGITEIDVYIEHIFYGGNEFKETGLLLPISAVSDIIDINDSAKWGTPNLLEEFVYKDDVYGVVPAAWPENNFMSVDFFCVFNSNITAKRGLEDPREYYENSKWTRDQFESTLHDYSFTDDFGNKVTAFASDLRVFVDLAYKSFGVDIAERDGNSWTSGYLSDRGIEALDWIRNIMYGQEFDDCVKIQGIPEQVPDWCNELLSIGLMHANFIFSTSSSGDSSCDIVYSGIPFAILPFPSESGNEPISQYQRTINAIMFPSWTQNQNEAATLVNAIFEPIADLNTREDMIDYYSTNLLFDRRDAELIFDMLDNCNYFYHDEGMNSLNREIANKLLKSSGAETMAALKEKIETLVNEEIAPVREGMESLFGFKY